MSTPAVSEAVRSASLDFPHPPPVRAGAFPARAGPAAHGRSVPSPRPSRRPAPVPSPAREILAGVLLLFAWAMLWTFFLTAVVEPGARLHGDPERRAALTRRWIDP